MSDVNLEKLLINYGLSDIEVKVYLGLLQLGQTTVLELARFTGIKRATVHFNVEGLIKKGLVAQTNVGSKRMIMAESPDQLKVLVENRKKEVESLEKNLPELIESMKNKLQTDDSKGFTMQVKYYEGKNAVRTIYDEALMSGELRSYVNLTAVHQVFPENKTLFEQEIIRNPNLKIREIVEVSDVAQTLTEEFAGFGDKNYVYKFTPQSIRLSAADVLMYDEKVAVISLQSRISGMVMHNREYFEISKNIFDFVWNILPDIN